MFLAASTWLPCFLFFSFTASLPPIIYLKPIVSKMDYNNIGYLLKQIMMSTASPSPGVHEIDWLAPITREILNAAQQEAVRTKARKVYPEHLLLGIIVHGKSKAAALLHINGIDVAAIHDYMQNALDSHNTPSD